MVKCGMDIITVQSKPNKYFCSWLFKFAGEISLLSPEKARSEYIAKARAVIGDAVFEE